LSLNIPGKIVPFAEEWHHRSLIASLVDLTECLTIRKVLLPAVLNVWQVHRNFKPEAAVHVTGRCRSAIVQGNYRGAAHRGPSAVVEEATTSR